MRTCSFEACGRKRKSRGYCESHARQDRKGKTLTPIRPLGQRSSRSLYDSVETTESCHLWKGALDPDGYGQYYSNGKVRMAHRVSYEAAHGPIPQGLVIDHKCHNKACVNVEHLRAVTAKQNSEHRLGAQTNNKSSGIRGVTWRKKDKRWQASVRHEGRLYHCGVFADLDEAAHAARAKRLELFTHNDADRQLV